MRRITYVCVPCRRTEKSHGRPTCPQCRHDMLCAGTRWRPPKRADDNAWRKIESGNWMTEKVPARQGHGVPYAFATHDTSRKPWWYAPRRGTLDAVIKQASETTDGDELATLARHANEAVRAAAAINPHLPVAVLATLTADPDPSVAASAVRASALPDDVGLRLGLTSHPVPRVRRNLAQREDLEPRVLARLLRDPDLDVRQVAAGHPAARTRDMRDVPLRWIPAPRLAEFADGHQLRVLATLAENTRDTTLTMRDALIVVAAVT